MGSYAFCTPRPLAVPGISWVRPIAPAPETAFGLKFDSARTSALSSAGSTPLACAACTIIESYGDASAPLVATAVVPVAAVAAVGSETAVGSIADGYAAVVASVAPAVLPVAV